MDEFFFLLFYIEHKTKRMNWHSLVFILLRFLNSFFFNCVAIDLKFN